MPRRAPVDLYAVDQLIAMNERVVTHADLKASGVPASTITHRIRPRGPWQRLLPGVVLTHRGVPTERERLLGALRYAGKDAVISGASALRVNKIATAGAGSQVIVLVPHSCQRSSHDYVVVRRTGRDAGALVVRSLPVAPVARALVDECRERSSLDGVRELVAKIVQSGRCSIEDLAREVFGAARQRTALSREVLSEVSVGIRSVAEARARELFAVHGVPTPRWNAEIRTEDDDLVAEPDAVWEDVLAAMELDSMRWHLGPGAYLRTQRRQRRLVTAGIPVLPVGPGDILDDPEQFVREVIEFRRAAARRQLPTHFRIVPKSQPQLPTTAA